MRKSLFIGLLAIFASTAPLQGKRLHNCVQLAELYRSEGAPQWPVATRTSTPDTTRQKKNDRTSRPAEINMFAFDKQLQTKSESFLLQNNTGYHITRITLKLVYKTVKGEMLDHRELTVECDILPHATKSITIDSFDRGYQYRYEKSRITGKKMGIPFRVSYEIIKYDICIKPE